MNEKRKQVLIFGLGRYAEGSGISAARFFLRSGAAVTVTDKKTVRELAKTVKLLKKSELQFRSDRSKSAAGARLQFRLGGHRMSDVRAADIVVRNPGVPSSSPYLALARRRGIPVLTDVSIFMQLCPCPILGVTGTRGKSTTTALLGEMARAVNKKTFVGGNIQRSPLTFLDKLDAGSLVVLELSSWLLESLEDVRRSPWGAIVTNIYPDHLNLHPSMRDYVRSKKLIFKYQRPGDFLVLNRDSKETRVMGRSAKGAVHWFSQKSLPRGAPGAYVRGGVIMIGGKRVLPTQKMKLRGDHNVANALAASALAHAVGAPISKIAAVLRKFPGLPNRQEVVRKVRGVTWINDTTATSPEAVLAALARFSKNLQPTADNLQPKIILIAGGTDKNFRPAQFQSLARAIKQYCKAVILFPGTATRKLVGELGISNKESGVVVIKDMRAAVQVAQVHAGRGDIIMLSPGAASFGLFKNEFDRGDQFVKFVRAL